MTNKRPFLSALLLAPGLFALVVEPAAWLARTWVEPAYDSDGVFVALLCLALAARAVFSGPAPGPRLPDRGALALLLGSAALRLAGRVLAINHLGALALVLDVWALGRLLRLGARPWPVSPVALAALFSLSLPAEQVLQRLLAHPLRVLSAAAAEGVLQPFFPDVAREGTLLTRPGVALSIDLPCSGAQGLVMLSTLALVLATRRVIGPRRLALGVAAVLLGALVANTTRIVLLFVWPGLILEPGHTLAGLVGVGLGTLPLLLLTRSAPRRAPHAPPLRPFDLPPLAAAALSLLGVGVALAPHHPLDVGVPGQAAALPGVLGDWASVPVPLSAEEDRYFRQFGGRVDKRTFSSAAGFPVTAMVVRTTAPLRHIHDPDRCLRGAGHDVQRLGVRSQGLLTTVWRSVDVEGRAWRVEASFVSDRGDVAVNGSDVAWRWLREPGDTWMLVERISPWEACELQPEACQDFEDHLITALELEASS